LLDVPLGLGDPDEVPEPPAVPVSRPGDLYLLGAHVSCPKCGKKSKLENALRK
jgi:site-specific DNA-methyltransferase (adenine-specific)